MCKRVIVVGRVGVYSGFVVFFNFRYGGGGCICMCLRWQRKMAKKKIAKDVLL